MTGLIKDKGYNYYDPKEKKIVSVRNRNEVPGWISVVKGGMGNTYTFYRAKNGTPYAHNDRLINASVLIDAIKAEQNAKAGLHGGSVGVATSDDTLIVTVPRGTRPSTADYELIVKELIAWDDPEAAKQSEEEQKKKAEEEQKKAEGKDADNSGAKPDDAGAKPDDAGSKPDNAGAKPNNSGTKPAPTAVKPTTPTKPTTTPPARPPVLPPRRTTPAAPSAPKFISGAKAFEMLRNGVSTTEILASTMPVLEEVQVYAGSSDDDKT